MFGGGSFTTGTGQQPQQTGNPTGFGGFSAAPPNASPFTFGNTGTAAPATAPTFGATPGGGAFAGFGQPAATTGQFGATPASGQFGATPVFGQPAATSGQFGATPAAGQFGAAPTAAPTLGGGGFGGFNLGGTAVSSTATQPLTSSTTFAGLGGVQPSGSGGFAGTSTLTGAKPFTFGNTSATPAPPTAFTFGTGGATTTGAFTGFGQPAATGQFGAAPAAAPTLGASGFGGFDLGTTVSSTATQPIASSTTFTGGVQASGAGGFGTTGTSAKPFTFGNTGTAAPATTSSFGGTTGVSGFAGFGQPATAAGQFGATPAAGQFGATPAAGQFGTAPAAASTLGAGGFGGFNLATATSSTATQPNASGTTFTGLGGVQASGSGGFAGTLTGTSSKPEGRAILDLPVPPEILQIVEELKNHMKNQKVKISEICRATDKNIDKVSEDVEETRLGVSNLSNQVHRQVLFCNALMKDIQEEMKNLEMAMVTRDTPFALQNEITAPTNYFYNLVSSYYDRMITYKREIERAEISLASLGISNTFSPKDLVLGLKETKETVITLAAKVQDLHEQIINEMAVNRNLRRFPMEGEGGSSRRRGVSPSGSHEDPRPGTTYDQAYNKLNVLFSNSPRSGGNESLYRPAPSMSTPNLNSDLTSPQPLFQTVSSTILGSPGALKRTKH